MEKVLKRSLSLLLAITLLFGSAHIGLGEVDFSGIFTIKTHAVSVSDLTFAKGSDCFGDYYSVKACKKSVSGSLTVPSKYNGLTVKYIDDNAFADCSKITAVTLPDSILGIGKSAFKSCKSLSKVSMKYGINTIGEYAFSDCTSLKSFDLGVGIDALYDGVFKGCTGLETITVPGGIEYIGDYVFSGCTALKSVTISDSPVSIGEYAFKNCTNLVYVKIPRSITFILDYCFYGCKNLKYIFYSGSKDEWKEVRVLEGNDFLNKAVMHYNATGHKYGASKINTSTGTKYKECSVCKEKVNANLGTPKLSKIEIAGNSVKISWNKVTYADGYYVYRKLSGAGDWKKIATVKSNTKMSYTDKTVTSNKTYVYKVKAYDNIDTTPYSTTLKILYISVPKLTKIANTSSGVKVMWGKVAGATSYNIYRKVKGASSWTYIANTKSISYTDKTAKSGTTYYYTVRAKTSTSVGAYNSTGIGIKCLAMPKLNKVENVGGGVKITWTKVTGADGYYVYRKAPGETVWKKIATVKGNAKVTYKDTNVASGKTYAYQIKAYSGTRTSYYAPKSLKICYLAVPSLTKVTSTTSGVKFTWSKVAGAEGYYVYRKTGTGALTKIATVKSGTSYLDKTAKKGTTYVYTVRAYYGERVSYYNTTGLKITDKY